MEFDAERFLHAWEAEREIPAAGIGTLAEKRLHASLKRTYAPDPAHREVKIGRYIADGFDGERVLEIQTAQFSYLRPKLQCFLASYPVTLVYPLARRRYLIWIDPETGESAPPHVGRRKESALSALHELRAILPFLRDERLTVELLLFDMDERRLLDGWDKRRKRGATLLERCPRGLPERVVLRTADDYRALLPDGLPDRFKVAALQKLTGLRSRQAYSAVHVFEAFGLLARDGTDGRAAVYRVVGPSLSSGENRS